MGDAFNGGSSTAFARASRIASGTSCHVGVACDFQAVGGFGITGVGVGGGAVAVVDLVVGVVV